MKKEKEGAIPFSADLIWRLPRLLLALRRLRPFRNPPKGSKSNLLRARE
jgi:hypothetical protein